LVQALKYCYRPIVTVWCRNNVTIDEGPHAQQTSDVRERHHVGGVSRWCQIWQKLQFFKKIANFFGNKFYAKIFPIGYLPNKCLNFRDKIPLNINRCEILF